MSEERPEEQMESESEEQSVGNSAEGPTGSESEDALAGNAAEQEIGTESLDSSAGEQEVIPEAATQETKEESRAGRFVKRALRWVVMLLVVNSSSQKMQRRQI